MDLKQIHYDIQHYRNRCAIDDSFLQLCDANESFLDKLRDRFTPLPIGERNRSRRALRAMNYVTYNKTMVGVPRGFKGRMLPYMEALDDANDSLIKGYNDAMPKYTDALGALVETRVLPDYHIEPLRNVSNEQSAYTKKISKFYRGDKEWIRLGTIAPSKTDIGLLYSTSESERLIVSDKWLTKVEHDIAINTTYLRSIRGSLESTADDEYKKLIRKAGDSGYKMATLLELVSSRSWETSVALKTIQNIRLKTIDDLL